MSFFSKMVGGKYKFPGTDIAMTGKDSKLNSGWDTAQFLNFSPLNPIAPVHVVNSGIQTYKETGNPWKSAIDPSGDDPLGIVGHTPKASLQAEYDMQWHEKRLPRIKERYARQREKNRNSKPAYARGYAHGGMTSMEAEKQAAWSKNVVRSTRALNGTGKKSSVSRHRPSTTKNAAGCCRGMGAAVRGGKYRGES